MNEPRNVGRVDRALSAAAIRLGMEIRRYRIMTGYSQQLLARAIGLSAHSNVSHYELGYRTPPRDLVIACEKALAIPPGHLQRWHHAALQEKADSWFQSALERRDIPD